MSESESSVSFNNKKQLEMYGYLSKDVTWEIQEDRREFLYQLDTVVKNWKGQLPNLLDFFQKEAIFWLLIESVIDIDEHDIETPGKRFIDFVARSAYKDDPYADKDGKPLLRRTTPVHHAAKHVTNYVIISDLFKIYDKFDVAYIDEDGLTHFQVACLYGLDTVVEKFLELGQDPNGLSRGTAARYPPLYLALLNGHGTVAESLLRRGADLLRASADGVTPVHMLGKRNHNDAFLETFFEIVEEKYLTLQVNAIDHDGLLPLHYALRGRNKKLMELLLRHGVNPNLCNKHGDTAVNVKNVQGDTPLILAMKSGNINAVEQLLRRGADPHLVNDDGETCLHIICKSDWNDENMAKMLFEVCDEKHQTVQVDARDNEGWTPLLVAIYQGNINLVECLLRRGASPNLADNNELTPLHAICERKNSDDGLAKRFFEITDELNQQADPNWAAENGFTPLHVVCLREDDDVDLVKMLFEIGDKFNTPIQIDARDSDDNTPLHFALDCGHEQIAKWLLRRGADINISDELNRAVKVDARNKQGETPLHHAIRHGHKKVFELLLRRDANPNLADNDGWTALHTICIVADDSGWAKMLFEISEENNRWVQIDARDTSDFTPLHHALVKKELRAVVELLLRKGAATNLVDCDGWTPLHTICKYADDEDRVKMLVEISNEENKPVEVDARDKLGRTPLHLALAERNCRVVEYLLKLGADPNLTDKNGFSPLHVISKDRYDDDELLELFFDASKEADRPVRVDVQDKKGRTPLQWAVANLSLDKVDVLLDRGADLSNFVFPSKSFFVERFRWVRAMDEKLSLASKIVAVVERLEKRGYEFDRSDVLNIMSLFADHGLFEKSVDLDEYWYDDEEFVSKSKEIMVNPSLSLHDLIRLRPEEAAKQLKPENYIELARSNKLSDLPEGHRELCVRHLCEKLSRGFFWPWALDAFYELKHCQLPVLCCEMIIAKLKNEDLHNICLACILA
ncbi:ankyrin-1-like [Trichogramma pretiosum]|uniref:ankyrin-1-like n=1 Tax=Trichogramma pretiosum TaxID=7493 RepID=UPI000C718DAB|nr:ankyrin-1-like [Trichogramma pretiosum]